MKKIIITLILTILFVPISVKATTMVALADIECDTYVIGTHIYDNKNYVMMTPDVMLAAKTITSNALADMKIYYRLPSALGCTWQDGLNIQNPISFGLGVTEIEVTHMNDIELISASIPNVTGVTLLPDGTVNWTEPVDTTLLARYEVTLSSGGSTVGASKSIALGASTTTFYSEILEYLRNKETNTTFTVTVKAVAKYADVEATGATATQTFTFVGNYTQDEATGVHINNLTSGFIVVNSAALDASSVLRIFRLSSSNSTNCSFIDSSKNMNYNYVLDGTWSLVARPSNYTELTSSIEDLLVSKIKLADNWQNKINTLSGPQDLTEKFAINTNRSTELIIDGNKENVTLTYGIEFNTLESVSSANNITLTNFKIEIDNENNLVEANSAVFIGSEVSNIKITYSDIKITSDVVLTAPCYGILIAEGGAGDSIIINNNIIYNNVTYENDYDTRSIPGTFAYALWTSKPAATTISNNTLKGEHGLGIGNMDTPSSSTYSISNNTFANFGKYTVRLQDIVDANFTQDSLSINDIEFYKIIDDSTYDGYFKSDTIALLEAISNNKDITIRISTTNWSHYTNIVYNNGDIAIWDGSVEQAWTS